MKHKTLWQVFTPEWIVEEILNSVNFKNTNMLNKKIIDPACGDGAFLKVIVKRIIDFCINEWFTSNRIKEILENSIYGIEIDKAEYNNCITNLNNIVKSKLSEKLTINWNIFNDDALIKYKDLLGYFDFVVWNPPYIRIHNLDDKTRKLIKKEFIFSEWTIDIYISFFELGFKLLNKKGTLGYITPNSYLHNSSYLKFREYLLHNKAIKELIDFKDHKVFKWFSTYTAITIINFFEDKEHIIYKELKSWEIQEVNKIKYTDITARDWSFSWNNEMNFLKKLYLSTNIKVSDLFNVQYWFATLRDKIFIGNITEENGNLVLFNNHLVEKKMLKKIVKWSTYRGNKKEIRYILFPYKRLHNNFIPIPEEELRNNYPYVYNYLLKNKNELLKRDIDKGVLWYEFWRSQGIQNSYKDKIVLSPLIKNNIIYYKLDKDVFVYSGIFITRKNEKIKWDIIENILKSDKFLKYIQITWKNFSGGYKSITSKQIKNYPVECLNKQVSLFT